MDATYSPSFDSRDLTMASRGIGSNEDRIHTDNPPSFVGNCTAVAKAKHWSGGRCQRHGTIWRPGRNLSAALGLNGEWLFAGLITQGVPWHPLEEPQGPLKTQYNPLKSLLGPLTLASRTFG